MRSIKREARGISPVIATILLIAVTAVAGGVIAAYVAGLYVSSPPLIVCGADGYLYDYGCAADNENYQNAVASITVSVLSGRIRGIGDSAYGGTTITVTNPTTGFSASVSLPDNTGLWGTQITATNYVSVTSWAGMTDESGGVLDNATVKMTVVMSPDTSGRLGTGSLISILLQPFGNSDAHIKDNTLEYRYKCPAMWDEVHTFNVTIAGRDSVSLSGYDGAYMMGMAWTE